MRICPTAPNMLDRSGGIDKGAIHIEQDGLGSNICIDGYFHSWWLRLGASLVRSSGGWAAIDLLTFQCAAQIAGFFSTHQRPRIDAMEGAPLLNDNGLD